MKHFKFCVELAIVILLGYMVYAQYNRDKRLITEASYWRAKAFKTDTVHSNTSFQTYHDELVKVAFKEAVPPKTETIYQPYIPDNVLLFRDSLLSIIDSIRHTSVDINPKYLKQFPESPKLLGALFSKDTLKLHLLKINGSISSQTYPVDYNRFKYQYLNSSIRAEELGTSGSDKITPKKSLIRYDGTYLNYDRDLLQGNHKINATVGFDVWKLRVQGYSEYHLRDNSKLEGGIRAGFRLF